MDQKTIFVDAFILRQKADAVLMKSEKALFRELCGWVSPLVVWMIATLALNGCVKFGTDCLQVRAGAFNSCVR